jgi:hypothetical protein
VKRDTATNEPVSSEIGHQCRIGLVDLVRRGVRYPGPADTPVDINYHCIFLVNEASHHAHANASEARARQEADGRNDSTIVT